MKIEELLKARKDQLDVEAPPLDAWEGISKQLRSFDSTSFRWWRVAAIIFVCTSIGLLIQNRVLQSNMEELASLGDISSEYSKIEQDYIHQVNQLESTLPLAEINKDESYQWLLEELTTLDEINEMYRSDIGKVSEEQLVAVLIDYYEKKIKLLKKLELEIERNSKQKSNEKTNTNYIHS